MRNSNKVFTMKFTSVCDDESALSLVEGKVSNQSSARYGMGLACSSAYDEWSVVLIVHDAEVYRYLCLAMARSEPSDLGILATHGEQV